MSVGKIDKTIQSIRACLESQITLGDQLKPLEKRDWELRRALLLAVDPAPKTPLAVVDQIIIFLASANCSRRDHLGKLLRIRHQQKIEEASHGVQDVKERLVAAFAEMPEDFSELFLHCRDASFELCVEGPKTILSDYSSLVIPAMASPEPESKLAEVLNPNLSSFARAKALFGAASVTSPVSRGGEEKASDSRFLVSELESISLGFAHPNPMLNSPYPFDEADSLENLIMCDDEESFFIKCTSLPKLVEKLTSDYEVKLRIPFFLTYNSFATETEVLNLLALRFSCPPPPNLTLAEIGMFKNSKERQLIRMKVFSVLRYWIKEHFEDFEDDDKLLSYLKRLLHTVFSDDKTSHKVAQTILANIEKEEVRISKKKNTEFRIPKGFYGKDEMQEFAASILECDEKQIAEQLTWKDFEVFKRIKTRECVDKGFSREDKQSRSPNIVHLTDRFNKVSNWVEHFILSYTNLTERTAALKKMIAVAQVRYVVNTYLIISLASTRIEQLPFSLCIQFCIQFQFDFLFDEDLGRHTVKNCQVRQGRA